MRFLGKGFQNFEREQDRHTADVTERITTPHSRSVINDQLLPDRFRRTKWRVFDLHYADTVMLFI